MGSKAYAERKVREHSELVGLRATLSAIEKVLNDAGILTERDCERCGGKAGHIGADDHGERVFIPCPCKDGKVTLKPEERVGLLFDLLDDAENIYGNLKLVYGLSAETDPRSPVFQAWDDYRKTRSRVLATPAKDGEHLHGPDPDEWRSSRP